MSGALIGLAAVLGTGGILVILGAARQARRGSAPPMAGGLEPRQRPAPPCFPPETPEAIARRREFNERLSRLYRDVLASEAERLRWGRDTSGRRYETVDAFLKDEAHRGSRA